MHVAAGVAAAAAVAAAGSGTNVWLGDGCFWDLQRPLVLVEQDPGGPFARGPNVSAVVGYAGGNTTPGPLCYSGEHSHAALGYAEAVSLRLDAGSETAQLRAVAAAYFAQYTPTPGGWARPDIYDVGPPYRSMIGVPGGVSGALFPVIAAANPPRGPYNQSMRLRAAAGPAADEFNTVWIYDSEAFPHRPAELYHQFHSGIQQTFPDAYVRVLWTARQAAGAIGLSPVCVECLNCSAGCHDVLPCHR